MFHYKKMRVDLNLINLQSKYAPEELIQKSESAYKTQIQAVTTKVIEKNTVKIILLAGPSSAGKTTTAKLIKNQLIASGFGSEVISMDNFFINRDITPILEDGSYDFENVNTVDIPYFKKFIEKILTTGKAQMPIFNFITGTREDLYIDIELQDNSILIIEGIHALNPVILDNHEQEVYRVLVNPNTEYFLNNQAVIEVRELRRIRRMIRDFYTRGIKPNETLKNWKNVVDGEKKYIFPYKTNADFILDSTHYYEPLMYKKYIPALLDDSKESKDIWNDLEYFEELDAHLVPKDSLLNEFLSGVIKNT